LKSQSRFVALEQLRAKLIVLENPLENTEISALESLHNYELKKHVPWPDEGYSDFLVQRKQTKFQGLQDPSATNLDVAG
jgi:hypothetical protein